MWWKKSVYARTYTHYLNSGQDGRGVWRDLSGDKHLQIPRHQGVLLWGQISHFLKSNTGPPVDDINTFPFSYERAYEWSNFPGDWWLVFESNDYVYVYKHLFIYTYWYPIISYILSLCYQLLNRKNASKCVILKFNNVNFYCLSQEQHFRYVGWNLSYILLIYNISFS